MIYLQLLLTYLKIGFFGFGGGYAMLSLIQNEIVVKHSWLTAMQLQDIVAISQMTPGPIAINSATYVGYAVTGNVFGSIIATFAVSLPPLTLMMAIAHFYKKLNSNRFVKGAISWIKPVTVGLIGSAALLFANSQTFIDWKSFLIFGLCSIATWFRFNSIYLIILSAIAGIILYI